MTWFMVKVVKSQHPRNTTAAAISTIVMAPPQLLIVEATIKLVAPSDASWRCEHACACAAARQIIS